MPTALTPHETWRFQLEDDHLPAESPGAERKPDPAGTWWILRSIPAAVQAQIQNEIKWKDAGDGTVMCPNRGTVMRLLIEHGVMGVENWKDADGQPVTIARVQGRDVADLRFLDRLAVHHRTELANAIDSRQKVTTAEGN
jgi:hypothetical protein